MRNLKDIKLFLLDMDGTIYLGDRLFDCTLPFLAKLEENAVEYLFLTNNSSKDKKDYLAKLSRLTIPGDEKHLITSGDVTIDYIKEHHANKKVFLVGTTALKRAFMLAGITISDYNEADVAVVGFDLELTYEKLNGLYQMVNANKPYICTHPDMVCPTETGFIPDIGATIAYIEALTGRRPDRIMGKPFSDLADAAAERFGIAKEHIAMVGDRLYTDIEMGIKASITSILVLSGETTKEDLIESTVIPDYVFSDLSEITEILS